MIKGHHIKISVELFTAAMVCLVVGLSQLAGEVLTGFGLALGAVFFGLSFIRRAFEDVEEIHA
jgi:hypothetical protein